MTNQRLTRGRELEILIEEHRAAKSKAGAAFVARDMVDVLLTIPETEDLTLKNLAYVLLDLLNACKSLNFVVRIFGRALRPESLGLRFDANVLLMFLCVDDPAHIPLSHASRLCKRGQVRVS